MIARLARFVLPALAAAAVAACTAEEAPEPKKAEEFAQVLAVAPQSGNQLGRVVVPAAALAEIKRSDLGDVRIFDARGRTLSLALGYGRSGESSLLKTHDLPAIALTVGPDGTATPLPADDPAASPSEAASGDASAADASRAQVLIDTRAITLPVVGIELAVTMPPRVAVTFTLERSADRKNWEPLADKVLLRPGSDPEMLGQPRIALPALALRGQTLRVSWEAGPDVAVTGARIFEAVERQPARVELETSGARLSNPHELRFAPQLAVPIGAIRVAMTGPDGIVPVQLFGRDHSGQPWGLLARGTLTQGAEPISLELSGASLREYRLVADQRSAGFSQVPTISLAVEPLTLFAAFNGDGPFNLAVGHPDARPAWFDPADLGKPSELLRAWRRPAEVAIAGDAPVILLAPGAPEEPLDPRKLALWGALLLGAAVLALAAWRVLRGRRPHAAEVPPA